jgi:hypothetical protein
MGQKMIKRYRRAVRAEARKQQNAMIESVMKGLFTVSRWKRIMIALQLALGKKKWSGA